MSEYIAPQRAVSGVLMLSGALPLDVLGVDSWPVGVPAQIRYTVDDPFRRQEDIDALVFEIQASGVASGLFDYGDSGHPFTDPSLPTEYDTQAAGLRWHRSWRSADYEQLSVSQLVHLSIANWFTCRSVFRRAGALATSRLSSACRTASIAILL